MNRYISLFALSADFLFVSEKLSRFWTEQKDKLVRIWFHLIILNTIITNYSLYPIIKDAQTSSYHTSRKKMYISGKHSNKTSIHSSIKNASHQMTLVQAAKNNPFVMDNSNADCKSFHLNIKTNFPLSSQTQTLSDKYWMLQGGERGREQQTCIFLSRESWLGPCTHP